MCADQGVGHHRHLGQLLGHLPCPVAASLPVQQDGYSSPQNAEVCLTLHKLALPVGIAHTIPQVYGQRLRILNKAPNISFTAHNIDNFLSELSSQTSQKLGRE